MLSENLIKLEVVELLSLGKSNNLNEEEHKQLFFLMYAKCMKRFFKISKVI